MIKNIQLQNHLNSRNGERDDFYRIFSQLKTPAELNYSDVTIHFGLKREGLHASLVPV